MQNYSPQDMLNMDELRPTIIMGRFWPRFWALMLDGLILCPLTLLTFYNNTSLKSSVLLILVGLIMLAYKSFFEFTKGATPGKMIMKLKVVDTEFQSATLDKIILRNIFQITSGIASLAISFYIYSMPDFINATSIREYSALNTQVPGYYVFSSLYAIIYLVDTIFLWSDEDCRSLHDRIAKTYVIKVD